MVEVDCAGRARWKIENEECSALTNHGYHVKHNPGRDKDGLANVLAILTLFAFTLHEVLDRVCDWWQQCRDKVGTRRDSFGKLRTLSESAWFRDWTELLETLLGPRQLVDVPTGRSRLAVP